VPSGKVILSGLASVPDTAAGCNTRTGGRLS
jgi:hypothetical protein